MGLMASSRPTYEAQDVARFLVCESIRTKNWVTNLRLQKLLYFAWIEYYDRFRAKLYEDKVEAWKYGPVVPVVYYEYYTNISSVILSTREPSDKLDTEGKAFLTEFLEKWRGIGPSKMIDLSHETDAWKQCYEDGKREEIPFHLMAKEKPPELS